MAEDWDAWFDLVRAFVATSVSNISESETEGPDRVTWAVLERSLDMYPEMRMGGGE